ncbi:Ig-like domain-containing protein, partial [Tenacibaculum geojense]
GDLVSIDVLGNDSNVPTDGSISTTDGSNGTVTVNDNGTPDDLTDDFVEYTPADGFTGEDTFTYTVCDTATPQNCSTSEVTVTVEADVVDPVVVTVDDSAVTTEGDLVSIDVLGNDSNVPTDGSISTIDGSNGTVTVNDNGTPDDLTDDYIEYTPADGFTGEDTFTYTVCDTATPQNCSTSEVTVTVNGTDPTTDPVISNSDNTEVDEDNEVTIDVLVNDENITTSGTLTIETDPANGLVVIDDNGTPDDISDDVIIYIPDADYNGTDSFTYTVCNNAIPQSCSTSEVIIVVNPVDDTVDDEAEVANDESVDIDVLANDTFTTDAITVTDATNPANGTVTINSDGTITYTPNEGFIGIDTFVYTVTVTNADGTITTETAEVTITVTDACLTVINEFSPNGDGFNDYLQINCIDKEEYKNNTVEIFNRWGNKVYGATGYNNDDVKFEGVSNGRATINQLEQLPVGTYYYIIDLGDGQPIIKGWIYINR